MNIRSKYSLFKERINKICEQHKYVLFLLIPAFILLFNSHNSFLYDINTSTDANCFRSCGEYILNGKVPYRDFFEHKGPIFYFFSALCVFISPNSFHSFYIAEVICIFLYAFFAYKTARLVLQSDTYPAIISILSIISYCLTPNAIYSNNVEEYCLPLLMYMVYVVTKYFVSKQEPALFSIFLSGVFTSFIFWSKFLICAPIFFIGLPILFFLIKNRTYMTLIRYICIFMTGFLSISLFVCVYFYTNNSLGKLYSVYFLSNISYGNEFVALSGHRFLSILISTIFGSSLYGYSIVYSVLVFLFIFKLKHLQYNMYMCYCCFSYICLYIIFSIGGFFGDYYYIPICVIYPLLWSFALINKTNDYFSSKYEFIITAFVIFSLYYSFALYKQINNNDYKNYRNFQDTCVETINQTESASICYANYTDDGMYLLLKRLPDRYYFTTVNDKKDEIINAWIKDINTGNIDYVFVKTYEADTGLWYKNRLSKEYEWQELILNSCHLKEISRYQYEEKNLLCIFSKS